MGAVGSTSCSEYACGAPPGWLMRNSCSPSVYATGSLFHPRKTLPLGGSPASWSSEKSPALPAALMVDPTVSLQSDMDEPQELVPLQFSRTYWNRVATEAASTALVIQ